MTSYDLLIKNGIIVDGTGAARTFGDIAIKDGIIEKISHNISADQATKVIDAEGLIVAPGVIDPHTHYDAQVHWDPYCTNSGWHGNTTVVVGNCGFGFMPCAPAARDRYMLMMENTEQVPLKAMRSALPWNWETFPDWMEHMKHQPKGINIASYMPLNSLMIYVMGYEAAKTRGATAPERQKMRDLLNEAMDHGAIGFGLSHLNEFNSHKDLDGSPMPTDQMQIEDAYYLAEVLRERDQGVIQALAELPVVVSNRHVVEELASISKRPVLHNVTAAFEFLPDYHRSVMAWLDEVEAKGLNIYSQAFAFRVWNEFNVIDYNAWQQFEPFFEFTNCGGAKEKTRLAGDPDFRARALKQYDPARMAGAGGAIETMILHHANGADRFKQYEGQTFSVISEKEGRPAIDLFFEIVALSEAKADFRTTDATSADPDKIEEILRHKRVIPGTSDGGAHIKFYSGGHYATDNIIQMVREEGRMSLEEIHFKLSNVPARILGLDKRGVLMEGYAADMYIYDLAKLNYVRDNYDIVRDLPGGDWRRVVRAQGIEWSIVNGEAIFRNSITTGALPGRMIGNGGSEMDQRLVTPMKNAAE